MNCGHSFVGGGAGSLISGDANAISAHDIVNGNQEIVHGNKEIVGGNKIVAQNYTINNNVQEEVFGASDVNVDKLLKSAIKYYEEEDYFNALKIFRQIAEKDIKAQYYIGECYRTGHGVLQSNTAAIEWYSKAASHGYPDAQFALGLLHIEQEDVEKGMKMLNMAASQGHKRAMYVLGALYILGVPEKDYERAYYYYSRLNEEDYPASPYGCAVAIFEKNPEEACKILHRLSKNGKLPAVDELSYNVVGEACLLWAKIQCRDINGYGQYDLGIKWLEFVIEQFENVKEEAEDLLAQLQNANNDEYHNYGDYRTDGKGNYIINEGVKSLVVKSRYSTKGIIPDDAVSVVIPNSITTIEYQSFIGCCQLKRVVIPDTVHSIEEAAFMGCGFEEITLPNSLRFIGTNAFSSCNELKSIHLPSSLESLGSYAFDDCARLTSVIVEGNITTVERGTFKDCPKLKTVILPDSIERIEEDAFYRCESLRSITLPSNLKEIRNDAFTKTGLTEVVLPKGVESIEDDAFDSDCKLTKGDQCKADEQRKADNTRR